MYPWLSLGLPIPTTFLLAAILHVVRLLRFQLKDVILLFLVEVDWADTKSNLVKLVLAIAAGITVGWIVAGIGLVWIGTIHLGKKCCLLTWILLELVDCVGGLFLRFVTWVDLAQRGKGDTLPPSLYNGFIGFGVSSYVIAMGIVLFQRMRQQEQEEDRGSVDVDPIGKGFRFLWQYYFRANGKLLARALLTLEILVDADYLVEMQGQRLFQGGRGEAETVGHEFDSHPGIFTEEVLLRMVRVVTNAVGIWLVVQENRKLFKRWCGLTLTLICISVGTCAHLMVSWEGRSVIVKISYGILFLASFAIRLLTLHTCWKWCRGVLSSKTLFYNRKNSVVVTEETSTV